MTPSDLAVRRATLEDVETVAALLDAYRQFYGREPDLELAREFLRERLRRNECIVYLAENAEGVPLGFAQLYPSFSSVALARTFVLNDLYVVPTARRRGVGGALLGAATAFCKENGAVRVSLTTQITNTAAQSLYTASGWTRQTEYDVYTLTP
jgi:ribosomal protein S18 acetylase RimI-like enzyme